MAKKVNILGIEHEIIEKENIFDNDLHMGQINYGECKIIINKDMSEQLKQATICHEVLHGILVHIGRDNLAVDEQFVTALGTAINQSFEIRLNNDDLSAQNYNCEAKAIDV